MILDKLLFFTEIINSGSISGASNCFNISTATGSRWVKDLEDKLNVKLLRISNRGIEPTEAGIVLFKEFSSINEDINQLYKKINTINNSNSGVISISSTPLFTMNFLSTIIGEYLYKYPDIRFRVEESPIINENNKNIDFYIKASSTYKGYIENNSDLVKKVLFSYPLILCCSPDYINKYGIPSNPFSLKHHNCLYASSLVGGNCWHFYIRDEITTLEIAKTVNIENSEFLKAVALMGGGIAYLPYPLVQSEILSGKLVSIMNDYIKTRFEVSLWFRKPLSLRCVTFRNFLVERASQLKDTVQFR